jgi:hypothetical protein
MTPISQSLVIGTAKQSRHAFLRVNDAVIDGAILATSKVPGLFGNRIAVGVEVFEGSGPPSFILENLSILLRLPRELSFEASGPFYYNGENPQDSFILLWYSGNLNGRKSYSLDGNAFSWPLNRDGEFAFYAEGSWNMILRTGGVNQMHWRADTDVEDFALIPPYEKSPTYPDAWYGVADGCTGWVSSHYGIDVRTAEVIPTLLEGLPDNFVINNPLIDALVEFSLPSDQTGTGLLATSPIKNLDYGT